MSNPSRKERERERLRQEILEAAELEFAQSGYRDTSMNAIAGRVELAVGTLYNFFPSKDALFISLLDAKATEFFRKVEAEVHQFDCPVEKIKHILRCKNLILLENLRLFRLFADVKTERNLPPIEKEHPLFTVKIEHHLQFLAGLFQEAIDRGQVRPMPPMLLAVCLDSLTFGIVEKWERLQDLAAVEQLIADLESIFFEGVLART